MGKRKVEGEGNAELLAQMYRATERTTSHNAAVKGDVHFKRDGQILPLPSTEMHEKRADGVGKGLLGTENGRKQARLMMRHSLLFLIMSSHLASTPSIFLIKMSFIYLEILLGSF